MILKEIGLVLPSNHVEDGVLPVAVVPVDDGGVIEVIQVPAHGTEQGLDDIHPLILSQIHVYDPDDDEIMLDKPDTHGEAGITDCAAVNELQMPFTTAFTLHSTGVHPLSPKHVQFRLFAALGIGGIRTILGIPCVQRVAADSQLYDKLWPFTAQQTPVAVGLDL